MCKNFFKGVLYYMKKILLITAILLSTVLFCGNSIYAGTISFYYPPSGGFAPNGDPVPAFTNTYWDEATNGKMIDTFDAEAIHNLTDYTCAQSSPKLTRPVSESQQSSYVWRFSSEGKNYKTPAIALYNYSYCLYFFYLKSCKSWQLAIAYKDPKNTSSWIYKTIPLTEQ